MFNLYLEQLIAEGFISDKIAKMAQGTEADPKYWTQEFNNYRDQYKLDINSFKTIHELIDTLTNIKTGKIKTNTQYKKAGLNELTPGTDYLTVKGNFKEGVQAFVPLNHKASKVIASSRVQNIEAEWCTATNDDYHWNSYIGEGIVLIYFLNPKAFEDRFKKIALAIYDPEAIHDSEWDYEIFDVDDVTINKSEFKTEIGIDPVQVKTLFDIKKIREHFKKNRHWIFSAKTFNADYQIVSPGDIIFWKGGTWLDGIWEEGIWANGVWEDGIWENGTWEKGTWKNGTWQDGIWHDGIWMHGEWMDGIWEYGTWYKGRIFSAKFKQLIDSKVDPSTFHKLENLSNTLEELKEKVNV